MNKTKKLILIDGIFLNEEAKEFVEIIFSMKINFYKLKKFSSQERCWKVDQIAQKIISEIKWEIEKFQEILYEAKTNNKKLVINSEISISLCNDI